MGLVTNLVATEKLHVTRHGSRRKFSVVTLQKCAAAYSRSPSVLPLFSSRDRSPVTILLEIWPQMDDIGATCPDIFAQWDDCRRKLK